MVFQKKESKGHCESAMFSSFVKVGRGCAKQIAQRPLPNIASRRANERRSKADNKCRCRWLVP